LTGGDGEDSFVFAHYSGNDTITDFQQGTDSIDLSALGIKFDDLDIQVRDDEVRIDTGFGRITLDNFTKTLTTEDFDF
jgi:hypothetical protein